jgi:hypothetical protein
LVVWSTAAVWVYKPSRRLIFICELRCSIIQVSNLINSLLADMGNTGSIIRCIACRPRHSSSGYSLASHRGGQGSNPNLVMWDLWWTKWRWGRFSPSTSAYHMGLVQ